MWLKNCFDKNYRRQNEMKAEQAELRLETHCGRPHARARGALLSSGPWKLRKEIFAGVEQWKREWDIRQGRNTCEACPNKKNPVGDVETCICKKGTNLYRELLQIDLCCVNLGQ
jgi:hypothetical protein